MTSHIALMLLFAAFVSVVFAALMRDDPREQVRVAGRFFATFVGVGVLLGWLLFPFPF